MAEYGVSQLPVLSTEPPVVMGEVAGAIIERDLLDRVFTGESAMTDAVSTVLGDPLPLIGSGESVSAARAALAASDALLVTHDGNPTAVLTRQDLLTYLKN